MPSSCIRIRSRIHCGTTQCIRRMNGGFGVGNGNKLPIKLFRPMWAGCSLVWRRCSSFADVGIWLFDWATGYDGAWGGIVCGISACYGHVWFWMVGCAEPGLSFSWIRFEDEVFLSPHEPHHHSWWDIIIVPYLVIDICTDCRNDNWMCNATKCS